MHTKPKTARSLAAALTLIGSLAGGANAAVIMTIDISNPAAAVFNATAANSQLNIGSEPAFNGIVLKSFFSGNTATTATTPPTITMGSLNVKNASGSPTHSALERFFVDTVAGGWTSEDIGLYSNNGFNMAFSTTEAAVTGSFTFDISAFSGAPTMTTVGDIYAGEPNSGNIIGQWQVVIPEPSSTLMFGLGALALTCKRRRS